MTNSPVYVLGTGLSHDGSVCLLADGEVVLAIEKERLTRRKHDGGNDQIAMQYVLDRAGITLDDIAVVVQNENFGMFREGNSQYNAQDRLLNDATRVVTISHHLAHAYSAFGASGFDQASVLVVDGCGNAYEDCIDIAPDTLVSSVAHGLGHVYFEKDSYYTSEGGTLRTVAKDFSPWGARGWELSPPSTMHSIGGVYQAFSQYVFGDFADSGKLMGLAPYGCRGRFDFPLFELHDGQVLICRENLLEFTSPAKSRIALKSDFQYYADVALYVQREIEQALLYLVRDRFERCPSRNLAYAGGVALNAVANSRILRETGFERIFIQPAAGDNGLAIGCAYYGWLQVLEREQVPPSGTTYLGASYPTDRVRRAIAEAGDEISVEHCPDVAARTAELLAAGKVVAWYRGGAEFGPRALGHRSILAHPGLPGLRDHINTNIKYREDFRPFAPSVIADEAARYFECDGYDSPYMILVFNVRPEYRDQLVNVVHQDGSSRLHTVTEESEPTYFRLLQEFKVLTGIPVLLNTSLNKRGMPIVETPEEALSFFLDCALDAIVLNDMVITKSQSRPASGDRVRGVIELPSANDIPLVGMRIASLAMTYTLGHAVLDEIRGSRPEFIVNFNDTPTPYKLPYPPQTAMQFFRLCDGVRTYTDIASRMQLNIDALLQIAGSLTRDGLVDHAALTAKVGTNG
jgi:carbamoyltransferase